jgi:hypothetical protein
MLVQGHCSPVPGERVPQADARHAAGDGCMVSRTPYAVPFGSPSTDFSEDGVLESQVPRHRQEHPCAHLCACSGQPVGLHPWAYHRRDWALRLQPESN